MLQTFNFLNLHTLIWISNFLFWQKQGHPLYSTLMKSLNAFDEYPIENLHFKHLKLVSCYVKKRKPWTIATIQMSMMKLAFLNQLFNCSSRYSARDLLQIPKIFNSLIQLFKLFKASVQCFFSMDGKNTPKHVKLA